MVIEVALIISLISVSFGVFGAVTGYRRNCKKDEREEAAQMTTVLVKLENISAGILEIKNDVNGMKNDMRDVTERLVRVESSAKHAHKRLNEIKGVN